MDQNNTQQTQESQVVPQAAPVGVEMKINSEWAISLALAFFLCGLGVHLFYNGKTGTGILMIFTLGGLGIWALIDFIMILFGKFTKKDGSIISVRVPAY
jgi:TM2 domain-containing membrane protein YozV